MRESYPVLSRGSPPSAVRFGEELSRKMGIFRVFLGKGRRNFSALRLRGGEEGIRTPDTLSGMPVFKTGAINHSATSPTCYKTILLRNNQTIGRRCRSNVAEFRSAIS